MQGDYMRLRYRLDAEAQAVLKAATRDGLLVLRVDEQQVATVQRLHDANRPLATGNA